jgi:4-hydroxybenzoyl-CoA reductase subunit alpha
LLCYACIERISLDSNPTKEGNLEEYTYIGKPVPRVDGVIKATGQATYAGDVALPGMLSGKILRSPYAHAVIKNIDISKARKLPGVRAIVTGKDFPGIKYGFMPQSRDQLPLAVDKVRHYGEGVAAVAAIDEDIAEEALSLITVDYEELPAVLTIEDALKAGAPLVHDHAKGNICATSNFNFGDVEKGFRDSDYIRQEMFTTQRVTVGFIEPHAVIASVDASGMVTIQASKQSPYVAWRGICRSMDLPLNKVRVINHYVGGGFSGKHDPFDLDFCAVRLSQLTGRPVKIVLDQHDILACFKQRHQKDIFLKLGVKKDGTLLACECKLIAEGGAYASVGPWNIYLFGTFLNVPYRLPNIKYEAYRIYTNKPPCGAVRGQSIVPSRFAFESLLSMIADDIGVDQVDIRLKNAIRSGETTANEMEIDNSGFMDCLQEVARATNWYERKKNKIPNRGIGFSCGCLPSGTKMGGHFASTVVIKLGENGTVSLIHGGTEIGQGCDTVLSQIVAEVLGLPMEDIRVGIEDTDNTVLDSGMFADKCTYWTGNATKLAAEDVKRQLSEIASKILEVSAEDLEFKDRKVFAKGHPERSLTFTDLARVAYYQKGEPVYGKASWAPSGLVLPDMRTGKGRLARGYGFVAQAAEVEVDTETGKVKVLNVVTAHDCGQPINPLLVDGQIEGGTVQMMGQALYEECLMDNKGRPLNPSFSDYKMPRAPEAPTFVSSHIIAVDPYGPFGAKGAGEASATTALGAVANAVYDAVGVRIKDLPITPEKVLKALLKDKRPSDSSCATCPASLER